MSLGNKSDLVLLFKNLAINLKPYAANQLVKLNFKSNIDRLIISGETTNISQNFDKLIRKIIAFTPENFQVSMVLNVLVASRQYVRVEIENTGADLSRVREIISSISYNCNVAKTKTGTMFFIDIPIEKTTANNNIVKDVNNLGYTPYYIEINKRLNTYFKAIESFELAATKKSKKEGAFLKNANKVINTRISDNNFNVDALAKAMALSRSQLFRKIKSLTQMSPNQYLLFYRLQVAKQFLKTNNRELNISEVGYQVGFISKSHFSRAFRKQFGVTPLKYKKMYMQH